MHKIRLASYSLIIFLICLYAIFSQYNPNKNNLTLQTTGFNNHFIFSNNLTFAEYVKTTQIMVKQARTQAGANNTDDIILKNSPMILLPNTTLCKKEPNGKYSNGIVLIHGLLDSPYSMQVLGKHFQQRCFVVYVILLPGHGTVPGDLLKVHYQDWIAATDFASKQLAVAVNNVWLGGFSLGGLLAINQALQNPSHYKALVLFAPSLQVNSAIIALVKPLYFLSLTLPVLQWWEKYSESSPVRYESITLNSIYQTQLLISKVTDKMRTEKLTLPLFILQSADDMTVKASAALDLMAENKNTISHLFWYSTQDLSPALDRRITQINSSLPKEKIIDLAHTSLILSSSDPIYGLHGSYKNCLHYPEQSPQWIQCKAGTNTYLGEVTAYNLEHYVMQRLSFNPFYGEMIKALDKFIESQ